MKTNCNENVKSTHDVASEAMALGLIECYCEARNTLEIRMDLAQAIAHSSVEEFVEFLQHIMENCSAAEFERFIESPELTSADRVTCIALFAKAHLPEDYTGEEVEGEECTCGCLDCCAAEGVADPYDVGEIGEGFDGRKELEKLIQANVEARTKDFDEPGLARLLVGILGVL